MERDAIKVPKYHQLTPEDLARHLTETAKALARLQYAAFLATYGDDREALSPKVYQDPEPDHDALSEGGGGL